MTQHINVGVTQEIKIIIKITNVRETPVKISCSEGTSTVSLNEYFLIFVINVLY